MLRFTTKRYRCSELLEESLLPSVSYSREAGSFQSTIDDFEGLFIGYGGRETCYPYPDQNAYCEERERNVRVAILENDELYAEFLTEFGGRLWKLFDKKRGRDLLYTNDVIRLRNLSIRNAWFSGGVEFNCGLIGHSPFTCAQMYCAKVQGDGGEEVLRFYEFERVRSVYYQMDFWLEADRLMVRVRIDNPNMAVVPMYWWSNMAVPEWQGGRLCVPADSAYNNSDGMGIKKSQIPFDGGVDVSYPQRIPDTIDYFYDIPAQANKFIANLDARGSGLVQISSHRLKGRKLFSWGHRPGSAHWQQMLTDRAGWYVEIQAGLGKTQYECLPMPPKTSWSFLECYTFTDVGEPAVSAEYAEFTQAVDREVERIASSTALDARCAETESSIAQKPGELVYSGSGFGYLQNLLCSDAPKHLTFTQGQDAAMWLDFMGEAIAGQAPLSFAVGPALEKLLEALDRPTDWRIPYLRAAAAYDRRAFGQAREFVRQAFVLDNNVFLNHLYAAVLFQEKEESFVYFAKKAISQQPGCYSVCESILRLLLAGEAYESVLALYEICGEQVRENPRIRLYRCFAYFKAGDPGRAEELLLENGGLRLPDFREGDRMLDTLYRGIRRDRYGETGHITVPEQFDFIVSKQGEA